MLRAGPSSRAGGQLRRSLTERTLMRIGVSNRHAILSLPTRLRPVPARGPALSTGNYWANDRHLLQKVRQIDENTPRSRHSRSRARARRRERKGKPRQGPPHESSSQKRQLLSAWVRGGSGQQFPHAQRRSASPTCRSRWAEPKGRGLALALLTSRVDLVECRSSRIYIMKN